MRLFWKSGRRSLVSRFQFRHSHPAMIHRRRLGRFHNQSHRRSSNFRRSTLKQTPNPSLWSAALDHQLCDCLACPSDQ